MRVGLLEVLGALPYARLEVRCDCGVTKTIRKSNLGSTKSCGCQRARRRLPVGFRSHQLVVLGDAGVNSNGASSVRVRCDCGAEKVISVNEMKRGKTKSCGCYLRLRTGSMNLRHGEAREVRTDGAATTSEYKAWSAMIARCTNTKWRDYANYGGRGISVCMRWRDRYENFLEDMGRRPSVGHSLDRIDVNGNYEPSNCRWATVTEQANNKRNTLWIVVDGIRKSVADWARETGISYVALVRRVEAGWDPKRIVTEPQRITKLTPKEQR